MRRGDGCRWLGVVAVAGVATACGGSSEPTAASVARQPSAASAPSFVATTVPDTPAVSESTIEEVERAASMDPVETPPPDPLLVSKMISEADLAWTSGYGTFPNQVGDDSYSEPPSVADLCASAAAAPLSADGSLHDELDAHDAWVFVDEWIGSAPDAVDTFAHAADALDHCPAEARDGASITFESREVPAVPGVDEARRYTIRVDPEADEAGEFEVLLARTGTVLELLVVERSDILEDAEDGQLLDAALTRLASGQPPAGPVPATPGTSVGERNDADIMATLDGYGPGNGGLLFTRTKAAIEGDVPRVASVDSISEYSLTDGSGGVGLMILTTPTVSQDVAATARDLALWIAGHAFVADGTLRNDDGVVQPEITISVGDQTFTSSYAQMVDLAEGRLSADGWLAATAQ